MGKKRLSRDQKRKAKLHVVPDHEEFARECAIDIPGPETDYLGGLAR